MLNCHELTCDIKRNGEGTLHRPLHRLGREGGAGEGGAVVFRRRRELQHGLGLPDGRDPLEGGRGAEVCGAKEGRKKTLCIHSAVGTDAHAVHLRGKSAFFHISKFVGLPGINTNTNTKKAEKPKTAKGVVVSQG